MLCAETAVQTAKHVRQTDRSMGTIVAVSARTVRPKTISRLSLGRVELEQRFI